MPDEEPPSEELDLARARDLEGRTRGPWVRRALLSVLGLVIVLGAIGALGQETVTRSAASPQATLDLNAPTVLRGGLMWRARITITTRSTIKFPRLILGRGFANGMQMNTIEPSPAGESSRGPRLVLSYDQLNPGDVLVVYMQFQVDPTTTGRQDATVELDDQAAPLARVDHTITVLP